MSFFGEPHKQGRPGSFTRAQHLQALQLRRGGMTIAAIARKFGVSHTGMSNLLRRAAHLEQEAAP